MKSYSKSFATSNNPQNMRMQTFVFDSVYSRDYLKHKIKFDNDNAENIK